MPSSLKSLRYTTAIAVSLVALSTANQAYAACVPGPGVITCTGASAGPVAIAGSHLTNTGTLSSTGNGILSVNGTNTITNNAGATISSTSSSPGQGALVLGDNLTTVNNSGTIINTNTNGIAVNFETTGGSSSGAINNNVGGVIEGGLHGIAVDGTSVDLSGTITNAGTIEGTNGAGIFVSAATSSSTETALISGGVINTGTITGDTGILVRGFFSTTTTSSGDAGINSITNSGTIEGTGGTAIRFDNAGNLTDTTLNINGGRIIGDVIDDFGTINGSGTAHISNIVITGSGFDTEGDFTVSSLTVNAGQEFRISTGDTFSASALTMGAGSTINFEVDNTGAVGLLNVTGGAINLTGGTIGAEVDPGAPLFDGQEILIGMGTADVIGMNGLTGQALTTVTDDYLLLDFAIADGGQADITGSADASELYFRVFQSRGLCDGVNIANPDAACNVLSTLVGTTNTQISNIISNITNATSEAERENILNATLPKVDGSLQAAKQVVTGNTIRIVSDRLTVLRDPTSGNSSGVSSGDPTSDHDNHQMWGQVFGQKARQGTRKGQAAYDIHTRGVTVGADMEAFEHAVVGAAFTYANSAIRTESANNTATDVDSYSLSLYGDYDMLDGLAHIIGTVGYTYSNKEKTRFNVGAIQGLNASSDFDSHQFEARLIGNYDIHPYDLPEWHVIPRVQVHYMGQQTEDIEETGAGGANLTTESEFHNLLEVGVGVDVQYEFDLGDGASLTPDVNAHYRYDVLGEKLRTTSAFDGGGASFVSEGAEPDQGTWNFGLGLNYHASNDAEISVSYDHEKKDKFKSHAGFIRAAVPF